MFVILGGFGQQGIAITRFLLEASPYDIITIDTADVPRSMRDLLANNKNISFRAGRPNPTTALDKLPIGVDHATLISCLPPAFNLDVTRWCLDHGWNYMDLGESTLVARKQRKLKVEAKLKGSKVVTQCGLAPGIVSAGAMHYQTFANDLKSINVYCGGIPIWPKPPLHYVRSFHSGGVIGECTGLAEEVRDGKVVYVPALSQIKQVFVPGFGILEAAPTSGGTGTAVYKAIKVDFSYNTLRYPGHWKYLIKHILTQPDPAYALEMITDKVSSENYDVIILIFELEYGSGDVERVGYRWDYNWKHDISAMSRATGYIAGAVATMIYDELVDTGVAGMEELDFNEVITRVKNIDNGSFTHLAL